MRAFAAITLPDIAKSHNLNVEYVGEMPATFRGYLDPHPEPRYIVVNQELHPADQSYVISRAICLNLQKHRMNSSFLNSPKKWKLADEAPGMLKKEIFGLDLEMRTHLMMATFGKPAHYFSFIKRHPERFICDTLGNGFGGLLFLEARVRKIHSRLSAFF